MKKIFAIAIISITTNCSPIHANKALTPVPVEPVLPKIKDSELNCLSQDTYERLARRDEMLRFYSEQLKELLK